MRDEGSMRPEAGPGLGRVHRPKGCGTVVRGPRDDGIRGGAADHGGPAGTRHMGFAGRGLRVRGCVASVGHAYRPHHAGYRSPLNNGRLLPTSSEGKVMG